MISLTAAQTQKAHNARPMTVTLVRLETYSDYTAQTVEAVRYWSTVPILYRWDGSNVVQFEGLVSSVTPLLRGMAHIPDADQLDTRDGLTVSLDAGSRAGLNVWDELVSLNLIGARIEVATLLLDWHDRFPGESRWLNQSTTTADHIVRFRGEVTQIPDWRDDRTTFDLVADSVEPVLDWGRALDETEVSERDLGKLYPIPVGLAARVPCTQRQVGAVTTLVSPLTDTTIGQVAVTDASGLPNSGFIILSLGSEFIRVTKVNDIIINIVNRGRTVSGVTSTAVEHFPGTVVIELIEAGRFVYAGIPTVGVDSLYARSPQTGELVLIPSTLTSYSSAMQDLDTGRTLGVVGFTQSLWAQLVQFLNTETKISTQPTVSSGGGVETVFIPFGSMALGTAGGSANCESTLGIDTTGVQLNRATLGTSQAAAILWSTSAAVPNQSRTVSRFRVVIKHRIESDGVNATRLYIELTGGFLNTTLGKTLLRSYSVAGSAFETNATAWQSPAATTLADLVNTSGTPSVAGERCIVYLDQSVGGGSGAAIEVFISSESYVEVELVPLTPTLTPAQARGGQELGFNLELFADIRGAVTLGARVSNAAFDSASGWTTFGFGEGVGGATPPTAFEGGVKFFASQDSIARTAGKLISSLDLTGKRIVFDVWVESTSTISQGVAAVTLSLASAGGFTQWGVSWPSAVTSGSAWHEISWTPETAFPLIRSSSGTTDLTAIVAIEVGIGESFVSSRTDLAIRNLRIEPYSWNETPMEVAQWLIEEQAGLEADASSFATADSNLGVSAMSGDLRQWGDGFANVLALIGRESRTNFVRSEGASGTVVKALNALSTMSFPAPARTIAEFESLRAVSRTLDERPTAFRALYDFRNDRELADVSGYRSLLRADATVNDITARVATATITAQQLLVGVRQADDMAFFLIPSLGAAINVWGYYVSEALRGSALRFTLQTSYRYGYDLEPGDVVDFTAPWDGSTIKARVTAVSFPFDAPSIELELEEVT